MLDNITTLEWNYEILIEFMPGAAVNNYRSRIMSIHEEYSEIQLKCEKPTFGCIDFAP